MTKQQAKAKRIAAALGRNADAVHSDAVSWEEFRERNITLWRKAEAEPRVATMVRALLRNDPNWREEKP